MLQQVKQLEPASQPHTITQASPGNFLGHLESEQPMQMQRALGNHGVLRHFGLAIQPKLTVSEPHDPYEQEADQVANTVMRMPEPQAQQQPEEEEEAVQAKRIDPVVQRQAGEEEGQAGKDAPDASTRIRGLQGQGRPLPHSVRKFFEPRFGADFSRVRVHTDAQAAESARSLNALAYTLGRDVVFGAGEYAPHTASGQLLIAHELMHTLQQGASGKNSPPDNSRRQILHPGKRLRLDRKTIRRSHGGVLEIHAQ